MTSLRFTAWFRVASAVAVLTVGFAASIVPNSATENQSTVDRFCDLCQRSFGRRRTVCDWNHSPASQGRALNRHLLVDQTTNRNAPATARHDDRPRNYLVGLSSPIALESSFAACERNDRIECGTAIDRAPISLDSARRERWKPPQTFEERNGSRHRAATKDCPFQFRPASPLRFTALLFGG